MHSIFFGLKRAFHGTLRVGRKALEKVGLTAARFDLMYALQLRKSGFHGVPLLQSQVRRQLGVSAPVVSRMLGSLEKLGLIRREVVPGDRRQRFVSLTEDGRRRLRWALHRYVWSGQIQLAVDSALVGANWIDRMACLNAGEEMDFRLELLRYSYCDTATLRYRWHPDD